MRPNLDKVPALLASASGREELRKAVRRRMYLAARPVARVYRRTLARRTRVIAVVGSLGKTTTTAAIGAAFDVPVLSYPLYTGYRVGLAILRIKPWQRHAVIEVGAMGGMAGHARIVQPDIVVVTSIASEHNTSFGSLDETRDRKALILRELRAGGLLVLNGDDARVCSMASCTDAPVVTFGFGAGNDVRATDVRLDWPKGMRFTISVGNDSYELRVRLLGTVMAYPVLAAMAVAHAERRPMPEVIVKLQEMVPSPGRLQLVPLPNDAWLIRDDFKSTLETIDTALDLLAEVPGRRIIVLGEISEPPGSAGPHYRRLGARLASIVSRAIIIGRKRSFQSYTSGATHAGMARSALVHMRNTRDAIEAVRSDLRPGDVVLIKGRTNQRLDRVALALQGRTVECEINLCQEPVRCEICPRLAPQCRSRSDRAHDGVGSMESSGRGGPGPHTWHKS